MNKLKAVVVVLGILVCAGPQAVWSQTEYLIDPADTDQEIDEWLQSHVVEIDRAVPAEDVLLLHFPGSFDIPTNSKLILQHAARRGYPAIGLRYPNSWTVNSLCRSSTDSECFEKVRLEILDGVDRTDILVITEANSISNRLGKLLQYLDQEHPDDDWGRFLDGDHEVIWSKVIVSGHSQGAGHAAMVAHVHEVVRVGMFAGVTDYSNYFEGPAGWVSDEGATPVDVHFGFGHANDGLVPPEMLLEIWTAQGLAAEGEPVNIDGEEPPYGGSHMFFTSTEPAETGSYEYHNSVVIDFYTPKFEDGSPRFAEVWDHMCFPDEETNVRAATARRSGRRVRPR